MENLFFEYLLDHLNKKNFDEVAKKTNLKVNFEKYKKYPDYWNLRAIALVNVNKPNEAIDCFLESYRIQNSHLPLYNIGKIFSDYGDFKKAYDYYLKSHKINKAYKGSLLGLINSGIKIGKYEESINYCKILLEKFDDIEKEVVYNFLGVCFENLRDLNQALKYYKNSLLENENFYPAKLNIANYYAATGDTEVAINKYKDILKHHQQSAETHRRLSILKKYKDIDDAHLKEMLLLEKKSQGQDFVMEELGYALSKAYEDIKNYEKSYYYFSLSNKLRDKKTFYDAKREEQTLNEIKSIFRENFEYNKENSELKSVPIFILGLPRSGSTLVEQILSAHSKVEGLEEIESFHLSLNEALGKDNNIGFKEKFFIETELKIKKIRKLYIDKVNNFKKTNSPYHTDKLPLNYKYIGFIKLAFPESKIIHTERDYRDVFVSILKNYFGQLTMSFAYNEDKLLDYINNYKKYLEFWKNKYPNFIYNISYEDLVLNPENQTQDLLKFCKLDFENNCLKFYENKKSVSTASLGQVRQPIYKSSSKSYLNYEKYLKKYFDKLS